MRLREIQWSRWGETDYDFAGIKLTNNQGQQSEILGMEKHELQSLTLKQESIERIQVLSKVTEMYLRGFKIFYRNGQTDLIGSDDGYDSGIVEF